MEKHYFLNVLILKFKFLKYLHRRETSNDNDENKKRENKEMRQDFREVELVFLVS